MNVTLVVHPEKTIKMPAESADKWLEALRSGQFAQHKGSMCNDAENAFCCLGVLQIALDGKIETYDSGTKAMRVTGVPSRKWLDEHNIEFMWPHLDEVVSNPYVGTCNFADNTVTAATMNDRFEWDFTKIADVLEQVIERT